MAHHRTRSTAGLSLGHTHALSLKVLRLSRPSLAVQSSLPATQFGGGLDIPQTASLAYPGSYKSPGKSESHGSFPLTPLLTLPPAFGAAYVGEEFTCTLCVNNELSEQDQRRVSRVRIVAEMQVPGEDRSTPVKLTAEDGQEVPQEEDEQDEGGVEMVPGTTMQRTLTCELKEEGPHQLAVTVAYWESPVNGEGEIRGRNRTFRKLYQFVAQPLIAIRSKVTERKRRATSGSDRQWVLEAQMENVGEMSVVLEHVRLNTTDGVTSTDLTGRPDSVPATATILKPQDVEQVMYLLQRQDDAFKLQDLHNDAQTMGPNSLAQVRVDWRAAMGEKGSLTTAWLATRGR